MATSDFYQVQLDGVENLYKNNGRTHESAVVTVTATMKNGSILKADDTEALIADAATATKIIDFTAFNGQDYAVGDVVPVPVIVRESTVDATYLKFSDGAYTAEALTALLAAGVILK